MLYARRKDTQSINAGTTTLPSQKSKRKAKVKEKAKIKEKERSEEAKAKEKTKEKGKEKGKLQILPQSSVTYVERQVIKPCTAGMLKD